MSSNVLEVDIIQSLVFLFLGSNQEVRALLLRVNRSWAAFCRSLACTRLVIFRPGLFVQNNNNPLMNLQNLRSVPVVHLQFASKVDKRFFEAMESMSQLETLTLSYFVDDEALEVFASSLLGKFLQLRTLECNFAKFVSSTFIRKLASSMPKKLESFVLQYCQNVDDEFFWELVKTSLPASLTNLDLFGSVGFGDAGLMTLANAKFRRLQRLVLGSSFLKPAQFSDATLSHVIPTFGELVVLDLSASLVSDGTVNKILSHLPCLLILKLASCPRIAFAASSFSPPSLCKHGEVNPLRHLALETLCVSDCPRLSDDGLGTVAHRFPGLRDLDLSFCSQVSDAGLAALGNLASLQSLKLVFVSSITSVGIESLLPRLKRLQYINLSNCPLVDRSRFESFNKLPTNSDLILEL